MKRTKAPSLTIRWSAVGIVWLVATGLGLLGVSKSAATTPDSPSSALTVEANCLVAGQEDHKVLRVEAVLINHGSQDATVLTSVPEKGLGRDAKGLVVNFSFTGRQRRDGRLLLPSLYPMAPVTLHPGEATQLVTQFSGRLVEPLHKGSIIRVQYNVRKEWGERFDLWHGVAETEVAVKEAPGK